MNELDFIFKGVFFSRLRSKVIFGYLHKNNVEDLAFSWNVLLKISKKSMSVPEKRAVIKSFLTARMWGPVIIIKRITSQVLLWKICKLFPDSGP